MEHGISVVMPVRNAGGHLGSAVESILTQSFSMIELIIIDDGSTDNAIEQLGTLLKDTRIRLIKSKGIGIVDALNTGIELASYSTIARMDGDDIAHPERLKIQYDFMQENPNIDFIGCQVEIFCLESEPKQGYKLYEQWINALSIHEDIIREIFIESPIAHPTVMFRKSTINDLGGYQHNKWPEDYDLFLRAFQAGLIFGKPVSSQPLLHWRDHEVRASRTQAQYQKRAFLHCKAHYLGRHIANSKFECVTIWGTGPTGLVLHDLLEEQGTVVDSFIDVAKKLEGRKKRDKPVHVVTHIKQLNIHRKPNSICLIAVSARGAREKIKGFLNQAGWQESQEFIFVA